MTAVVERGDRIRVWHSCADVAGPVRHDDPVVVTDVVPSARFGTLRVQGIRCDGSDITLIVDPQTGSVSPGDLFTAEPLRVERAPGGPR